MKRILTLTALALGLSGGVALADRHGGRGDRSEVRDHRGDRVIVRDHDRGDRWRGNDRRWENRDRRWDNRDRVRVVRQRPTFRNNRFYFGNSYREYHRPVFNVRYRDYYRRPALVVENYDPVPGYIWTQGSWSWNGYEWIWMPGHYEVDQNYYEDYGYNDSSYDYSPGFSASASVNW